MNIFRDDYRELAELALVLLGGKTPGHFTWKKPGACHKARFCSFGIYSLKILAFSEQLDLDEEFVQTLKQFCVFTTTIYIPYFLTSSVGRDSGYNDLKLFKTLFTFRNIDPKLADESLVVLRRHCWYLTPECVIFCLFSEKIDKDEKSRLAVKLLTLEEEKPRDHKLEKPKFPSVSPTTELVDLLSPESFKFFDILGLNYEWLAMDPDNWNNSDSYRTARDFVTTLKVTNDVAERGVKLATDFATMLTRDDEMREKLLQGVERCRRIYPELTKAVLNK